MVIIAFLIILLQEQDIATVVKQNSSIFYTLVSLVSAVFTSLVAVIYKLYNDKEEVQKAFQKKDDLNRDTLKDLSHILSTIREENKIIAPNVINEIQLAEGRIIDRIRDKP